MIEPRRLGRSGLKVSPLGLGTARIAGLGWREDLKPQFSSPAVQDAVRQIQASQFGPLPMDAMQAIAEKVEAAGFPRRS